MPRLLAFLEKDNTPGTQTSAGDFIKAIVTISANASQNEQSCIGPNNLTRQLVSEACIENLLSNMLRGGNPLTVGVGMIIEVIRKNNSDYDPDVGAGPDSVPSSNDPIYLGTLLRCFAKRVPDFMALLLSPNHAIADGNSQITIKRKELGVAFGNKIEPLGFDRFKTCELMAELLHCSNMGLLNERGSEAFVRQRDEERERLKAEGALTAKPPTSAVTEFSEDSTNFANGASPLSLSTGPEGIRKLEVQNNAEDDGFEDVGNSADLSEDIKDDFDEADEKSTFEREPEDEPAPIPSVYQPVKPRLDLDEDFVDEPLTSPRLEAMDEREVDMPGAEMHEPLSPKHVPEPASPTSRLASEVKDLAVEEDTTMARHQTHQTFASPETTEIYLDPQEQDSSAPHINTDAPPLPHRERPSDGMKADTPEAENPRAFSPHPDDKPAPLFATRLYHPSQAGDNLRNVEGEVGGRHSHESVDTTQGQEGDSDRSVLMSGCDHGFVNHFEYDIDGQPMVGDFLKMMFVDHHVVPTILVSKHSSLSFLDTDNRMLQGLFLSISVEQLSSQCSI